MDILNGAYEHTGVPDEGDNLMFSWEQCSYTDKNFGSSYYGLYFKYVTTLEQERELSEKITATLASLNLESKSDFEKIEAIHDWICSHVVYDHNSAVYISNNIEGANPYNQTAYGAMCLGTCVCNGYALLCYRMMLEAGIECRYLNGTVHGNSHAWNIVKLEGNYYIVDTTNDSASPDYDSIVKEHGFGYTYNCPNYNCFLKGTDGVAYIGYKPEPNYDTDEFHSKYPISKSNYTGHHIHEPMWSGSYVQEPTCTEIGYSNAVCRCGNYFVERGIINFRYGHQFNNGVCSICGVTKATPDSAKISISSLLGKSADETYAGFESAFSGMTVRSIVKDEIYVEINEAESLILSLTIDADGCSQIGVGTSYKSRMLPDGTFPERPASVIMDCMKDYPYVTLCYDIPVAISMNDLEKELNSKGIEYERKEQAAANTSEKYITYYVRSKTSSGDFKSSYWIYNSTDYSLSSVGTRIENFLPGDLNTSGGDPDVLDGVVMQRILAGLEPEIPAADLNGSGDITVADGVVMQRILAGLE